MPFKKATREQLFLRMAIEGPAGSGKTMTALKVARTLAGGKGVAVIDTERASARKYADMFEFDTMELEHYHPKRYVDAINEAVGAGYGVVVIDSLSHAWDGRGGILEIVHRKGNSFSAWADIAPIEDALLDALTGAKIHVIATIRTKVAYDTEKNEQTGKIAPRKVGLAAIQRQGIDYEFDIVARMDDENTLTIQKTRCSALSGAVISKPGEELAGTLRAWLSGAPTPQKPRLVETTSAQEALDGEEETIYYAPEDEPEPEPEREMTRAEFLTTLRDELNLNATQAMNRLKVRSLSGLNLRAALETLRQSLEQRPEPGPIYNPKADAKLRQRLNALQIRTLAEVETFIAEAEEQGDGMSLRDACYAYLERQEETARTSAKAPMAAARTPTRGRGPSALGATPDDGAPTPDSLESLETGARAS